MRIAIPRWYDEYDSAGGHGSGAGTVGSRDIRPDGPIDMRDQPLLRVGCFIPGIHVCRKLATAGDNQVGPGGLFMGLTGGNDFVSVHMNDFSIGESLNTKFNKTLEGGFHRWYRPTKTSGTQTDSDIYGTHSYWFGNRFADTDDRGDFYEWLGNFPRSASGSVKKPFSAACINARVALLTANGLAHASDPDVDYTAGLTVNHLDSEGATVSHALVIKKIPINTDGTTRASAIGNGVGIRFHVHANAVATLATVESARIESIWTADDGGSPIFDTRFFATTSSTAGGHEAFRIRANATATPPLNLVGNTLEGSITVGGNLTLTSTSDATKGKLLFGTSAYDEVNNRLGVRTASPDAPLHVVGTTHFGGVIWTWPAADGTVDQVFSTSGTGTIRFINVVKNAIAGELFQSGRVNMPGASASVVYTTAYASPPKLSGALIKTSGGMQSWNITAESATGFTVGRTSGAGTADFTWHAIGTPA